MYSILKAYMINFYFQNVNHKNVWECLTFLLAQSQIRLLDWYCFCICWSTSGKVITWATCLSEVNGSSVYKELDRFGILYLVNYTLSVNKLLCPNRRDERVLMTFTAWNWLANSWCTDIYGMVGAPLINRK